MRRKILTFAPALLILILILILYLAEGLHILNSDVIQYQYAKWKGFVQEKPLLSALYFIGIYILSVVLVLPDSTFLSLLGGFLFPLPLAVLYACVGETIGATLFFCAIKYAFVKTVGEKRKHPMHKMLRNFEANQASYLLFFRLSHLIPFWLINTGAGLFHGRTSTFLWTTCIGVLPLTFFLVSGAESLSKYLATHAHFQLKEVFTTQMKISLIALSCLALLPILFKKFKR